MKQQQRMSSSAWAARVSEWQASGLTAEEYGQRNGVNGKRLSWWKWHLRGEAKGSKGSQLCVGGARRGPKLLPVRVVASQLEPDSARCRSPVEVVLVGGRVVRLSVDGPSELMGLIRILEGLPAC